MNSDGIKAPLRETVRKWFVSHRNWCIIVLLPTFLVASYFYLIATDQYESEAHFLVRNNDSSGPSTPSIGAALGISAPTSNSQINAASVADYLTSHDAVAALQKQIDLVDRFRRPEADIWSRLWVRHPTPEMLLDYYRTKARVEFNTDTGITTLRVQTFRPQDSYAIITALLNLSEMRVNSLNKRAYDASLGSAQRQLSEAEKNVADVQAEITKFRRGGHDFNPQTTGISRTNMVSQLQASLAQSRAQEAAMAATLSPNSPQLVAQRARTSALASQVAREQAQLSSGAGNVATGLGVYEGLLLRQQFASKRYDSAAAAVEKAREQMQRQQLFVVRVVEPNMAVKALYPKRLKIVFTTFFVLVLAYGIGWLIVAGMKEHAA